MVDYKSIVKDCFWDSNVTIKDLQSIVHIGNEREMKKLFSKIIYNSNDKLKALQLFTSEQLEFFFKDFQVTYNKKYITKHVLILKSLLLNETHAIKGLEWTKR